MKRFFRSIIACICGLTIVFSSAVPPAFARDGVIGGVVDGVQSFTEWGVNNLNSFWKIIFGDDFNSASEEELKAAYDEYVQDVQTDYGTTEFGSDGLIIPIPIVSAVTSSTSASSKIVEFSGGYPFSVSFIGIGYGPGFHLMASPIVAPVSGTYWLCADINSINTKVVHTYPTPSRGHVYGKGDEITYAYAKDENGLSSVGVFGSEDKSYAGLLSGRFYLRVEPSLGNHKNSKRSPRILKYFT